jgi:hypothetical protein
VGWRNTCGGGTLVNYVIPLFIFAATICRVFEDPYWDPEDSLIEILARRNNGANLDGTYLPVLNRLLNGQSDKKKEQLVQEFHQVVGAIVILESPLPVMSLSRLLGIPERLIQLRLSPLHPVLSVPGDKTLPVRLYHLSFRDFLLEPETRRKSPFGFNKEDMHYKLTLLCLAMCQNLRKNICGLPSDGAQRVEIGHQTLDQCLPQELQYACRYWAHHLVQCKDLNDILHNAYILLQKHFLHWVEAMSPLGHVSEVVRILNLIQKIIPVSSMDSHI